ncbi:MAG: DUF599 domain-containing protein [Alphaproteobacteria bacterium]|nr:DUF599 domain-containing protein [Alphaproteobacteria bacterium]
MPDFTGLDYAAITWLLVGWIGYTAFADFSRFRARSLSAAMDRYRRRWMVEMMRREMRMVDTSLVATLQQGIGFFATTAILVVGGLVAAMGAAEPGVAALSDLPFAVRTSKIAWEIKVLLLLAIFIYCFFKFAWAFRLSNYFAILIGAAPVATGETPDEAAHVERAVRLGGIAAHHANGGLRAYYFGLAALGWFLHPALFALATTWVVLVLYRREFHSRALRALNARS